MKTDLNIPKMRKFSRITGMIFIISLVLKNPFIACTNLDLPFYNKVLNDFDSSSYFIALNLKSPDFEGRVIIENNNLYRFLNKTKGFNKDKYISFMKKTLAHQRTLKTEEKDIDSWKFIKVKDIESVMQIADRGKDNFVAYYFNGILLNYGITEDEQNAIINQLFYWEYPAKIDKLTGSLIIG